MAGGGTVVPGDTGAIVATTAKLVGTSTTFLFTVDSTGNLYISDNPTTSGGANSANGFRIRKVDTNGQMTTIAGAGTTFTEGAQAINVKLGDSGPSEMAIDGAGNL